MKKLKIEVNKLKKITEEQNERIIELEKITEEQHEIIIELEKLTEYNEEEIKELEKQNYKQYEIIENDEEEIEILNSKITKLTREINELRNNNIVKPKHSYPRSQMTKNGDDTPKLCYY